MTAKYDGVGEMHGCETRCYHCERKIEEESVLIRELSKIEPGSH